MQRGAFLQILLSSTLPISCQCSAAFGTRYNKQKPGGKDTDWGESNSASKGTAEKKYKTKKKNPPPNSAEGLKIDGLLSGPSCG